MTFGEGNHVAISLGKNAQKEGDFVDKKSGVAAPEVQMVREDGVVKAIPVAGIHRLYEREADVTQDLLDDDVVNDPVKTGVGQHLAQQDGMRPQRLESHQVTSRSIYAVINQAIDKIVAENQDCYGQGWEQDTEFVEATVELVLSEYDFEQNDVIKVIGMR